MLITKSPIMRECVLIISSAANSSPDDLVTSYIDSVMRIGIVMIIKLLYLH